MRPTDFGGISSDRGAANRAMRVVPWPIDGILLLKNIHL